MKAKLNKCDDEYLALLSYRDTPQANGYSPAQLSMGRKLKTRVPCHPDELLPKLPDYDEVRKREKTYREKMAHDYNHRHRVVDGEQLSPGDRVWIPDLRTEGLVVTTEKSFLKYQNFKNMQITTNKKLKRKYPIFSHIM